jgi:hypothetical protein
VLDLVCVFVGIAEVRNGVITRVPETSIIELKPSLRVQRSNPYNMSKLGCFVTSFLAKTLPDNAHDGDVTVSVNYSLSRYFSMGKPNSC